MMNLFMMGSGKQAGDPDTQSSEGLGYLICIGCARVSRRDPDRHLMRRPEHEFVPCDETPEDSSSYGIVKVCTGDERIM